MGHSGFANCEVGTQRDYTTNISNINTNTFYTTIHFLQTLPITMLKNTLISLCSPAAVLPVLLD